MNNVFNYISAIFLKNQDPSIYKRIYYDKMFYLLYGIHNISWGEKTFYDLIYKLKYCLNIPSECIIMSVIYMKRLFINNVEITVYNIRNIFNVCLILSCKFLLDNRISLSLFSKILNIPINYLVKMELYLIKSLDYNLFVYDTHYDQIHYIIMNDTHEENVGYN